MKCRRSCHCRTCHHRSALAAVPRRRLRRALAATAPSAPLSPRVPSPSKRPRTDAVPHRLPPSSAHATSSASWRRRGSSQDGPGPWRGTGHPSRGGHLRVAFASTCGRVCLGVGGVGVVGSVAVDGQRRCGASLLRGFRTGEACIVRARYKSRPFRKSAAFGCGKWMHLRPARNTVEYEKYYLR